MITRVPETLIAPVYVQCVLQRVGVAQAIVANDVQMMEIVELARVFIAHQILSAQLGCVEIDARTVMIAKVVVKDRVIFAILQDFVRMELVAHPVQTTKVVARGVLIV